MDLINFFEEENQTTELYLRPLTIDSPLTELELMMIEKRLLEIEEAIKLCSDCGRDGDVLDNLESECEVILNYVKLSIKNTEKYEAKQRRKKSQRKNKL